MIFDIFMGDVEENMIMEQAADAGWLYLFMTRFEQPFLQESGNKIGSRYIKYIYCKSDAAV